MTMRKGQPYLCQNPNGRDEVAVTKNSTEEEANLRCHCTTIKKVYSKPVLREFSGVEAIAPVGDVTLPKHALTPENRQ
jgi:hypothetical protein